MTLSVIAGAGAKRGEKARLLGDIKSIIDDRQILSFQRYVTLQAPFDTLLSLFLRQGVRLGEIHAPITISQVLLGSLYQHLFREFCSERRKLIDLCYSML